MAISFPEGANPSGETGDETGHCVGSGRFLPWHPAASSCINSHSFGRDHCREVRGASAQNDYVVIEVLVFRSV